MCCCRFARNRTLWRRDFENFFLLCYAVMTTDGIELFERFVPRLSELQ